MSIKAFHILTGRLDNHTSGELEDILLLFSAELDQHAAGTHRIPFWERMSIRMWQVLITIELALRGE